MEKTPHNVCKKISRLATLLNLLFFFMAPSTNAAGNTIADAVMISPNVLPGEDIQVYIFIPSFGVCTKFVETVSHVNEKIEIDIDTESSLPPGTSCIAVAEPQQHIVTLDPLPEGQYSLAVTFRGHPQVDNVFFNVSGETNEPAQISPASGTYVESQKFDMAVIVKDANISDFISGSILVDGRIIASQDTACFVSGTLSTSGVSFRCPNLSAAALGAGVHHVSVVLGFADINLQQVSASVVWKIIPNTEI